MGKQVLNEVVDSVNECGQAIMLMDEKHRSGIIVSPIPLQMDTPIRHDEQMEATFNSKDREAYEASKNTYQALVEGYSGCEEEL